MPYSIAIAVCFRVACEPDDIAIVLCFHFACIPDDIAIAVCFHFACIPDDIAIAVCFHFACIPDDIAIAVCFHFAFMPDNIAVRLLPELRLRYENGLPVVAVPLPSRRADCLFTLRPISATVGEFIQHIQDEDRGVDKVAVYNTDGVRIAKSTRIDTLVQSDFHLEINDQRYLVRADEQGKTRLSSEHMTEIEDIKNAVARLHAALHIDDHKVLQEQELQDKLEQLRDEIEPFEQVRRQIELAADRRTTFLQWFGLGLMGLQFGLLARLTWWEYSWDIMEPVTYFVTYGTAIALYAYYVVTKQEYNFKEVSDREFLLSLHRNAAKHRLNVHAYNRICRDIAKTEETLNRLRDPIQLTLPPAPPKQ
ncbi:Calcium uniporter protein, mitochondrial [Lamellibrachia satsuma]|nr:Calcium uniporter protein, mitochondrial [Lamellibrachia satsuma]